MTSPSRSDGAAFPRYVAGIREKDEAPDKIDRNSLPPLSLLLQDIANFSGDRDVIKLFTIKGRGYYRVIYGSLSPPFTRQ